MLITPQEVHDATLTTRKLTTGYDMDETDQLLDNCEQTIRALTDHAVDLQYALHVLIHTLKAHNIPIPELRERR